MIMEILTHKPQIDLLLITLLSFLCICCCALSTPPGSIQLSQQLLISSLDAASAVSQPFLTSASGTYEACLVRTQIDSGNTSCSIIVQGKGGGASNIIGCGRISGSHVCSLVFSTAGLGIFDGMKLAWSTRIPSGVHAKGLVLLDSGDMVISDSSRRIIAWKASESRIVADHNCGSSFSPFGNPSDDESLGRQVPPSDLISGDDQQDSVMGDFEQHQEGLGNYPKQPQGRRHSGFLGFDDQQLPYGADIDQQGHTDDDDDASVNGASGIRGLEIIGVVIVTFIYAILIVS